MSDRIAERSSFSEFGKSDRVGVVIVSAGSSTRMTGLDKTLQRLGGTPMVGWSVSVFEKIDVIDKVVVVVSNENIVSVSEISKELAWSKVTDIVPGGSRRQDSVRKGLEALGDCDWVLVHDGARPLVTKELILRALDAAETTGAATPGIPVKDTIKEVRSGIVAETLNRENLRVVQTPQAFRGSLLRDAHANVADAVTDDASMVEIRGAQVRLFEGDEQNIKITTRWDLLVAEASVADRSGRNQGISLDDKALNQ